MTTSFFNYFTRYAEAVRLPVEPWALDTAAPAPEARARLGTPRVALISDEEIAATTAAAAAAKDQAAQARSLGLGMANSQRAMLRAPALACAWREYRTRRARRRAGRPRHQTPGFVRGVDGQRVPVLHAAPGAGPAAARRRSGEADRDEEGRFRADAAREGRGALRAEADEDARRDDRRGLQARSAEFGRAARSK